MELEKKQYVVKFSQAVIVAAINEEMATFAGARWFRGRLILPEDVKVEGLVSELSK